MSHGEGASTFATCGAKAGEAGTIRVAATSVQLVEGDAQISARLQHAAAAKWSVDVAQTRTENGFVIGPAGRASYGELAGDAAKLTVGETKTRFASHLERKFVTLYDELESL